MKLSIVTPTYNREDLLPKLYASIVGNRYEAIEIEWLIMDDGSTDHTKALIDKWKEEKKLEIKYYYQENQGKMAAINKIIKEVTGDLIVECDSDDYFSQKAFEIIRKAWEENKDEQDCYAICFLKYNQENRNIGNTFKNKKTTMFDLYFKEGEDGEKALVFFSQIRKQYSHKLEKKEKFVTEARMYYEMDLDYKIQCINEPIMICEYQEEGYSNNMDKQFKENPYGYYEYFKEILQRDFKGVNFSKRLYVIKQYILFSYLSKQYQSKSIRNWRNKILYYILLLPGLIKSSFWAK